MKRFGKVFGLVVISMLLGTTGVGCGVYVG
jgi:hypothetical protein